MEGAPGSRHQAAGIEGAEICQIAEVNGVLCRQHDYVLK
jgi:hypothetical protein